ncbi:MAG: aldo/keto reductase [Kofleriaceae bacterium]
METIETERRGGNEPARDPRRTLSDGASMPLLGVGTWPLDDDDAETAVRLAFAAGYRLVDTAARYGNEAGVGRGVRSSGLDRGEVFVASKLRGRDHGYDAALRGFEASAERLGLDYVDLYLIHWPLPHKDLFVETWRAFVRLRDEGRVRSIGVSNFQPHHIERLIDEVGVTPVVNQIELHPDFAQPALRAFDARHGIATEAWSPLGRGEVLHDEVITSIAHAHGWTPAQVVLRWHLELGAIAIPRATTAARLRENRQILELALDASDMSRIAALDRGNRLGDDPDLGREE